MNTLSAVIFAGGKSSRMGEDKALLPFNGYPSLSQYQYQKLKKYFHKVYLSSKVDKFEFDCQILYDTKDTSSPLVALVSAFEQLSNEALFVLSVDSPLVDASVFETLIEAYDPSYDAIIAQSPTGIQALCGIYHRSILPLAQEMLQEDKHKLRHLLTKAKTKFVLFEEEALFTNLNYKQEYEALQFAKR